MDNGRDVSELSDVWSLAVVASEILTGEIPFDSPNYRNLTLEAFVDALAMDLRPSLPAKFSEELRRQVNLRAFLKFLSFRFIFPGTMKLKRGVPHKHLRLHSMNISRNLHERLMFFFIFLSSL